MTRYFIAIFAISLTVALYVWTSGSTSKAQLSDTAAFLDFTVTVQDTESACVVDYRKNGLEGKIELDTSPPCLLIRDTKGALRIQTEGEAQAFAVVSGKAEASVLDPLTARPDCGTRVFGLIYERQSFRLSKRIMGPGTYCANMGLEQRDFWLFVHDDE